MIYESVLNHIAYEPTVFHKLAIFEVNILTVSFPIDVPLFIVGFHDCECEKGNVL